MQDLYPKSDSFQTFLIILLKQRFVFNHVTKVSAETFSTGRRRLIQTYLYKFVEMILRVTTQYNMAEISLNRTPQNLGNNLMDLYFLNTYFNVNEN